MKEIGKIHWPYRLSSLRSTAAGSISIPNPIFCWSWRLNMDKNRPEGVKREIKGAVKEAAGKVTGNKTKQAAGNAEKNAGKVQRAAGQVADTARDAGRKPR